MSKELVISATRHETRVALIEDDQVVEIFHQRENEYSLAGSIHKGRVTRVLPGMQSAFVDIGLERDAFLYVSDFFEDNEEYDKIVTGVEEKVLKLDRTGQPVNGAPEAAPPVPADGSLAVAPAETAAPASPVASAPPPMAPQQHQGPPDSRRDDRDRGRRGRRRRGGRGRGGLPESKFYSPGQRSGHEAPPAAGIPEAAPQPEAELTPSTASFAPGDADFFVLPGESLAKYTPPDEQEAGPEREAAPFEAAAPVDEIEAEFAEPPAEDPAEPAIAGELAEEAAVPNVAQSEPETIEVPSAVEAFIEHLTEMEEPLSISVTGPESDPEPESAPITEAEAVALEDLAGTGEEPVVDETEPLAEAAEIEEAPIVEFEGPEPARIPTSLTATLREQGPRYQHRLSRRMRRKSRGERGAPGGVAEATRTPEQRQESRPEQRTAQGRNLPDPREKTGQPSITDLLKEGQEIIVQIAKEPLGQKGARITSHIALPGRFLVYMPTVDHIGVSRKIPSDDERLRLKRILQANRSGIPGGYIVRTAGDGHSEEELRADMMFLYNMWLDMRQKAERKPAPLLVHHDLNVVERILRDQLTSSFKSIWVDNEEVYEGVLRFVQRFQPTLVSRVKLYTRSTPIFDEFNITSELEKALRPKVWLKSGGCIVINQTEALVAIDINTGKYVGKSNRLEDTIVKTNTDAVKEIVRQIRLRDLGGIIVIDFIDMDERKNRQKVMQTLEEAMRADRAPYKILQFNDFGLVAITRKRVKQSLERTLCVPCTYCEGAGYLKSPQTMVGEILQEAHKIARAVEGKDVMLRVSPEVAKLLKSNQNTYLQELEEILGRTVIVKSDPLLHQEKFDLA
ncbi:MAG TPA: Rne/Rng family ribonuclease [Bryobacteraceae bacterium]|nr:Rne/Rng family ribonuclease [Bryobacteraceae bacterium]